MSEFGSNRARKGEPHPPQRRGLSLGGLIAASAFVLAPGPALAAVPEVPTLGEWGVLLLSLILLTGGWFAVRRTNRSSPEQNRDPGGS